MRSWKAKLAGWSVAALAAAAWLGAGAAADAWLRLTGALVADGGGTWAYAGKPVAMVSLHGAPPDAVSSRAGVYHVLAIFAADSVAWVSTESASSDVTAATHDEWTVWSRPAGGIPAAFGRSLDSRYNALLNRVTIHGRAYPLSRGNLFVARFGRSGQMEVVQLPRHVPDRSSAAALKAFQAALGDDPVVRGLYRSPRAPCPRRAPSAAPVSQA